MITIKREPTTYSVFFNDIRIEAFSIDAYGDYMAELLAKTFANGFDCARTALQCNLVLPKEGF